MKGAARAVNILDAELICQAMEKIFSAWKRLELQPEQQQFDYLHKAVILLQQGIAVPNPENIALDKKTVAEISARLNSLIVTGAPVVC